MERKLIPSNMKLPTTQAKFFIYMKVVNKENIAPKI